MFPIVVCGNHFPVNPVTRNYVEGLLQGKGMLQAPGIQPLAVIDLDELESCVSLAKAGVLLPELLADWLADVSYRKGIPHARPMGQVRRDPAGAASSRRGQPARGDGRDPAPVGHQARRRPAGLSPPVALAIQPISTQPLAGAATIRTAGRSRLPVA